MNNDIPITTITTSGQGKTTYMMSRMMRSDKTSKTILNRRLKSKNKRK